MGGRSGMRICECVSVCVCVCFCALTGLCVRALVRTCVHG